MRALTFFDKVSFQKDYNICPQPNETLIKITMAGICNTDIELIKGYMGFNGTLGHEFVGIVEDSNNKQLIGKRVCGEINCACGDCSFCNNNMSTHCPNRSVLGIVNRNGCFADQVYLPEKNLHLIPDSISDEEAVFVEPIAAAFEIVEQIKISPDDSIVVLGDGKLGIIIAQVLSLYSKKLVVIGKHINKLSILEKMGIKTLLLNDLPEMKADIVVEATGRKEGLDLALNIVRPRGKVILKTTIAENTDFNISKVVVDEITLIGSRCGPFKPAIEALKNKQVNINPLIEKVYDFNDAEIALNHAKMPGTMKVLLKLQ